MKKRYLKVDLLIIVENMDSQATSAQFKIFILTLVHCFKL